MVRAARVGCADEHGRPTLHHLPGSGRRDRQRPDVRAVPRVPLRARPHLLELVCADAAGAARGEDIFRAHWGAQGDQRTGWLRGTPKETLDMLAAFRDAGCTRVNIAFREGPYDWDALHAFADVVFPVFGVRRAR